MTVSTDWKEEIPPGEEQHLEELARQIATLQGKDSKGAPYRALHAKGHLGLRAQLTVLPGIPEHARVGIFAAPGTYDAWGRFSNAGAGVLTDQKPDIRGFAIKVLGVPGRKIIPGMEDATTQDLLFITTPTQAFRTADEFVFFVTGARSPLTLLPRAIGRVGFGRTLHIVQSIQKVMKKIPSLSGQRFWSTAPVRWGAAAAKYSAIPVVPNAPGAPVPTGPESLSDDLADRLARTPIEFDFAVQFYVDPVKTPIEDASVEWREEDAPFTKIGRITLLEQDLRSEAGKRQGTYVESLSFDPWHAPVEFRPLGNFQRARNHAYRISTIARHAAKEPEGAKTIVP